MEFPTCVFLIFIVCQIALDVLVFSYCASLSLISVAIKVFCRSNFNNKITKNEAAEETI